MKDTASFLLGQVPSQSVGILTGEHKVQIVGLIIGAVIQITSLYLTHRTKKKAGRNRPSGL